MNTTVQKVMADLCEKIGTRWASSHGAGVTVAEDPAHAIDLLMAGQSNGCAVVIFYMSDTPTTSEFSGNTMVDATIRVGIVQKNGLALRDGRRAPAVLEKVDAFRRFMARNADVEGLAQPLEYAGMAPVVQAEGRALNGYALSYTARYAFEIGE